MTNYIDENQVATDVAAKLITQSFLEIPEFSRKFAHKKKQNILSKMGSTYRKYVFNVCKKYGYAKTFFVRDTAQYLYSFYVPVSIENVESAHVVANLESITRSSERCVIMGSAGCGKSTLMRHLLVDSAINHKKIPVLVELRKLSGSGQTLNSIIIESLHDLGVKLDEETISETIEFGAYVFLLDGFDEVNLDRRDLLQSEIDRLSLEALNAVIIVSSRPDNDLRAWGQFSTYEILPLSLSESCELISKIPFDEEVKDNFTKDLVDSLYSKHTTFLANPLLLTIMLLTYGQNSEIPDKLSTFYRQAYEALFQRHDSVSKPGFKRQRRCGLGMDDFGRVFAAFAIRTYDKMQSQLTESQCLKYLRDAKKITLIDFDEQSYLDDAKQAVCLLIEDGLCVVYTHRSFEEFFSSCFIESSHPERQAQLLNRVGPRVHPDKVLPLCYEMIPDVVDAKLILPLLAEISSLVRMVSKPGISHYRRFAKHFYKNVSIEDSHVVSVAVSDDYWKWSVIKMAHRRHSDKRDEYATRMISKSDLRGFRMIDGRFSIDILQMGVRHPFIDVLAHKGGWVGLELFRDCMSLVDIIQKRQLELSNPLEDIFDN